MAVEAEKIGWLWLAVCEVAARSKVVVCMDVTGGPGECG